MADTHVREVSIGHVKRDISELVNRVAYGQERVVLTSRGRAKAALVSMEDFERLRAGNAEHEDRRAERAERFAAWVADSDRLNERILAHTGGAALDVDALVHHARAALEERDRRFDRQPGR